MYTVYSISKWSLKKTTFLWDCFSFEMNPVCLRNTASWKETLQSNQVLDIFWEYSLLKTILCFWNSIFPQHVCFGVLRNASENAIGNFTPWQCHGPGHQGAQKTRCEEDHGSWAPSGGSARRGQRQRWVILMQLQSLQLDMDQVMSYFQTGFFF